MALDILQRVSFASWSHSVKDSLPCPTSPGPRQDYLGCEECLGPAELVRVGRAPFVFRGSWKSLLVIRWLAATDSQIPVKVVINYYSWQICSTMVQTTRWMYSFKNYKNQPPHNSPFAANPINYSILVHRLLLTAGRWDGSWNRKTKTTSIVVNLCFGPALECFGMRFKTFSQDDQISSFSIINLFYNLALQEIYTNITWLWFFCCLSLNKLVSLEPTLELQLLQE